MLAVPASIASAALSPAARGVRDPRLDYFRGLAPIFIFVDHVGLEECLLAPMDKTALSPWRLVHILAAAYLVAMIVNPGAAWLRRGWARWVIACGRSSLDIFTLGTILCFVGMFVLVEAGRDLWVQIAVNAGGIGLMMVVATWLLRKKAAAIPSTAPAPLAGVSPVPQPAPPPSLPS